MEVSDQIHAPDALPPVKDMLGRRRLGGPDSLDAVENRTRAVALRYTN
jgi:hypothetical protein